MVLSIINTKYTYWLVYEQDKILLYSTTTYTLGKDLLKVPVFVYRNIKRRIAGKNLYC